VGKQRQFVGRSHVVTFGHWLSGDLSRRQGSSFRNPLRSKLCPILTPRFPRPRIGLFSFNGLTATCHDWNDGDSKSASDPLR
jgi:hypothetical protein